MDARVARGRGADQLVERDAVDPGQREQQLERGAAGARLQAGQGALGDAGLRRQLVQRRVALPAQGAQARTGGGDRPVEVVVHPGMLPCLQQGLPSHDATPHGRRGGGRHGRVDGRGRRRGDRRGRRRVERGADAGPGAPVGGGDRRGRAAQRPGAGRARAPGPRRHAAGRAAGAGPGGGPALRRPAGGRAGHGRRPRRRGIHRDPGGRPVGDGAPVARDQRPGRRVARRGGPARPVGPRRAALPVLPRLGGPRPGRRRAGERADVGAPGVAVPAADRRRHLLLRTPCPRPPSRPSSSPLAESRSSTARWPRWRSPTTG